MNSYIVATDPFMPSPGDLSLNGANFLTQDTNIFGGSNDAMCIGGNTIWSSESKRRMPDLDAIEMIKMQIAGDVDRQLVAGGPANYNATMLGKLMSQGCLDMNSASSVLMEAKKIQKKNDNTSASNKADIKSNNSFEVF